MVNFSLSVWFLLLYYVMSKLRKSVLGLFFKNKGGVQSRSNYVGIKMISHTMKILESRLRDEVMNC